ncbi:GerAB/ArcD/ProY family transporter [Alkaliphilus transvaalensis]|uniref:GerAB/ArcD/ProY family transporter n=1 Tax=Alkaliphilus transvaalensis TaxID=114628 RepID=UPI00047DFC19|nr:endospore germination permease [Alkaliphilus transvaalensis]
MDKFNSMHLAFLIAGTTIVSLKTYPKIYTQNGLRDSWIAMIIASILILLFMIYVINTCRRSNTYNLLEIYQGALGKTLGNIMLGFFCFTLYITLIESAAVQSSSMHTNMLLGTPIWFFILLFVGPAIYTIVQDKVAIITVTLVGIALITVAGINLASLSHTYKRWELLFPIFSRGISRGFIMSILQILGLYGCVAITFPYLIDVKTQNKLLRHTMFGILYVIQMQIVSITGVIATFDIGRINQMPYPKLLQTQLVSHFRFLEAGELFVMLQIVGGWYLKYVITFYALVKLLKAFRIKFKYQIYIISLLVAVPAFLVARNIVILFQFLNIYAYIALVNFIIVPTLVFLLYSVKQKRLIKGT